MVFRSFSYFFPDDEITHTYICIHCTVTKQRDNKKTEERCLSTSSCPSKSLPRFSRDFRLDNHSLADISRAMLTDRLKPFVDPVVDHRVAIAVARLGADRARPDAVPLLDVRSGTKRSVRLYFRPETRACHLLSVNYHDNCHI